MGTVGSERVYFYGERIWLSGSDETNDRTMLQFERATVSLGNVYGNRFYNGVVSTTSSTTLHWHGPTHLRSDEHRLFGSINSWDNVNFTGSWANNKSTTEKIAQEFVSTTGNVATVSTSLALPANCIPTRVHFHVKDALTGPTTWSSAFTGGLTTTLVTNESIAHNTAIGKLIRGQPVASSALEVELTANGGNFTAGEIVVTVWYVDIADRATPISAGSASGNEWTETSGVLHPDTSSDDVAFGGTDSTAPFFFDVSAALLYIQGTQPRIQVINPSGDTAQFADLGAYANSGNLNLSLIVRSYAASVSESGAVKPSSGLLFSNTANSNGLSIATRHADGDIRFYTGGLSDADEAVRIDSDGRLEVAQADKTVNAWGTAGVTFNALAATYTDGSTAASGTAASNHFVSLQQPTLDATNSAVTTTDSATLYIGGAPSPTGNMSITNPWALLVDDGAVRLDGTLAVIDDAYLGGTDSNAPFVFNVSAAGQTIQGTSPTLTLINPSGDTTSFARVSVEANSANGNQSGRFTSYAGSFSGTGSGQANRCELMSNASNVNGLSLTARHPSGGIHFYAGGSGAEDYVIKIDSLGRLQTGQTDRVENAWGTTGIIFDAKAADYKDDSTAASGTASNAHFVTLQQPTLSATNTDVVAVEAATLYIAGAPLDGTNMSITNPWSLKVNAGNVYFGGEVHFAVAGQQFDTDSGGINYRVPTGDVHDFLVNGVSQLEINATQVNFQGNTIVSANFSPSAIDDVGELAAAIRTGDDTKVVTGTAGSSGTVGYWNTDGDLIADTGLSYGSGAGASLSLTGSSTGVLIAIGGSTIFKATADNSTGVSIGAQSDVDVDFIANNAAQMRIDTNSTGGNVRLLVYDVDNGQLERVSVGSANSGGSGFKLLRIPN